MDLGGPLDLDRPGQGLGRGAFGDVPFQCSIHRLPAPGRNHQPIVDLHLLQDGNSIFDLVDSLDRSRDLIRPEYDPAHLQCAIERPE